MSRDNDIDYIKHRAEAVISLTTSLVRDAMANPNIDPTDIGEKTALQIAGSCSRMASAAVGTVFDLQANAQAQIDDVRAGNEEPRPDNVTSIRLN